MSLSLGNILLHFVYLNIIMEPTGRPWKKDAKIEKGNRKQEGGHFTRKEIQQQMRNLEDDKVDHPFEDPLHRKALRFWKNNDEKFYSTITPQQATSKRDLTTSNQILTLLPTDTSPLPCYYQDCIDSLLPTLKQTGKIRVLYKSSTSPFYSALAVYEVKESIPSYHTDSSESTGVKITATCHRKQMKSEENQWSKNSTLNAQADIKGIRLDLEQICEHDLICQRAQHYQHTRNSGYIHFIDEEIAMWEWELQKINQINHMEWNKLIRLVEEKGDEVEVKPQNHYDYKIRRYQDKLLWGTVLRCFQQGFKDKTWTMWETYLENQKNYNLKPPKAIKGTNSKKFFQTDCKICFCSDNSQSNQVIYCDNCNTSFHLACYGLSAVPKEDPYYCERCNFQVSSKQSSKISKSKKFACQICFKSSFPMKKFEGHFYHVTCLIIFNLVEIREGKMELKGSINHQNIAKLVMENQLQHDDCQACIKPGLNSSQLGMQLQCSYKGCKRSFHPICAYIFGCKFNVKKAQNRSLLVEITCNEHLAPRTDQVYFRRYMCDLKDTSSKKMQEFRDEFQKQYLKLSDYKQASIRSKKKYPNQIFVMTKFLQSYFKSRVDRSKQRTQPCEGGSEIERMLMEVRRQQS